MDSSWQYELDELVGCQMQDYVSVVVPIYNAEKYLSECIESIINQTYPNFELILVNDGSTDSSDRICEYYAEKDNRIKYLFQENSGQNAARLTGVKYARGKWIVFVDADDFVSNDMCEILLKAHDDSGADIVMGRLQKYVDGVKTVVTGKLSGVMSGKEALFHYIDSSLFDNNYPPGMLPILFQRETILDALTAIDKRINFGEDSVCSIFALLRANTVFFEEKIVYFYRMNTDSCMHSHRKSSINSQVFIRKFLREQFEIYGIENDCGYLIDWFNLRALLLGGYEFFNDYPGFFPFCEAEDNTKCAIYGAGVFGEEILSKTNKKDDIVAVFDRQFELFCSKGKNVASPSCMDEFDFTDLIIAVTNPAISQTIESELLAKYNNKYRIHRLSVDILNSEYAKHKLCELDSMY